MEDSTALDYSEQVEQLRPKAYVAEIKLTLHATDLLDAQRKFAEITQTLIKYYAIKAEVKEAYLHNLEKCNMSDNYNKHSAE